MTWRNQATHRAETAAVKAALVKAGYPNAKVGHGSGTAWGWLHLNVSVLGPKACTCGQGRVGRCDACQEIWRTHYAKVTGIALAVTGRHGEYDGDINAQIELA